MSGVTDLTKTAPWSSDAVDLITRTLTHIARCSLLVPGGAVGAETLRNAVVNPTLEVNGTGWSATTGTFSRDTAAPISGTASAKVVGAGGTAIGLQFWPTTTTDRPAVVATVPIDVSCMAKVSVASTQLRLDYEFYNEAGTQVGATVTGPTATPAANTPVLLYANITPPAGATRIRLLPRTVPNVAAGVALWADSAFVGAPGGYFDGSTTDTTTEAYSWENAPHASVSIANARTDKAIPLDLLESGSVTWDETRSPRVQASIVCKVPPDQALLDQIDPRKGVRLAIYAGYLTPSGQDVQLLADLGLRTRTVSRPSDTMTLTAWSDEALLIDAAATASGNVSNASTSVAIVEVIKQVLPDVSPTITSISGPPVISTLFTDRWDVVADLADRIGAQVYDNGLRQWFIAAMPSVVAPPALPALCLSVGKRVALSTLARTNLSIDPRAVPGVAWRPNDPGNHTVTMNVPVTGHPQGITTAARSVVTGATGVNALSMYSPDGLDNSGTVRGYGGWTLAPYDADVVMWHSSDVAGTKRTTRITANVWTYCTSAAPGSAYTCHDVQRRDGSNVAPGDAIYVTGSIAEAGTVPASFFDGDTPDTTTAAYEWLGTPGLSGSTYSTLELTPGRGGTIIASDTALERDAQWANYVYLHYEWDDAGTTKKMDATRRITDGPYAAVTGNLKILREDRAVAATQAEANSAAASLVKRTVTRGRSFSVEAISAYWLRPGHSVEVQLPLGGPETHLVTAVTFDLKDGSMNVTTRLPDGTYTIGAYMSTEYAWLGLAAAVPIVIVVIALALRGYDITLVLRRRKKDD